MSETAIVVDKLSKSYRIDQRRDGPYRTLQQDVLGLPRDMLAGLRRLVRAGQRGREPFWALDNVSFEVQQGEALGVIGRNGAGKSTLLKILSRITEPTSGRAELYGRTGSLLEVGTGFHPELTGRENVYLNGAILGMRRTEIAARFDQIVEFAEVQQFIDTPVKRYSSGMYMRLAFSVAAHLEPEILLVDEVLAVGDVAFQKKCLRKMEDVAHEGRTILFVSHNMQAVRQMCDRTILLVDGRIAFAGPTSQAITRYFAGSEAGGLAVDLSDARRRSLSHDARLTRVEFLNMRGEPVQQVSRQETLRVRVHFTSTAELPNIDLAMALVHADGTRIFSESLSDHARAGRLSAGDYELEFRLDLAFLKLETYFLTLYLTNEGKPLDYADGIPLPEIVDPHADSFMEAQRWGVVRIPLQWSEPRADHA